MNACLAIMLIEGLSSGARRAKSRNLLNDNSLARFLHAVSEVENHRPRTNRFEGPQTGCVEDGSGKLNESSSLALHTRLCSRVM